MDCKAQGLANTDVIDYNGIETAAIVETTTSVEKTPEELVEEEVEKYRLTSRGNVISFRKAARKIRMRRK